MSPAEAVSPITVRTGAVALLVSSALYGCWPIVCRTAEAVSSAPLPAARQSVVVTSVMLLALVPLAIRHHRRRAPSSPTACTDRWRFLALGITDALNNLCFFAAIQLTSVAVAVLCHYVAPLLVTVLSPLVLGERRRRGIVGAVVLALLGLLLVLRPWTSLLVDDVVGAGVGLLSAVFYAASVLLGKGLVRSDDDGRGRGVVEVAGWPTLVGLPVVLAVSLCSSGGVAVEASALAVLVVGAVVCGVVPLVLFYAGLRRLPASHASLLTMIEPVTAVVIGAAVLGEPLSLVVVFGVGLVLAAVAVVAR